MTSSIQLAEECLKQSPEESERLHAVNGVEDFAKTIDSSKFNLQPSQIMPSCQPLRDDILRK